MEQRKKELKNPTRNCIENYVKLSSDDFEVLRNITFPTHSYIFPFFLLQILPRE